LPRRRGRSPLLAESYVCSSVQANAHHTKILATGSDWKQKKWEGTFQASRGRRGEKTEAREDQSATFVMDLAT
jgi:hypothetical protein